MQAAVFLFVAFVALVSGAPADERIAQGTPVPVIPDEAKYPFVVSITENGNHFCGGFIYNAKFIVTSASCMEGKTISLLTVVTGQYNLIELDPAEQEIPVFKVTNFDNYVSANKTHDIALVELSRPIDFAGIYEPYTHNILFNEVYTDDSPNFDPMGTVMGWGATVIGGGVSPRLRYTTAIMTEAIPDCPQYTQDEFGIATMICGTPNLTPGEESSSPCTFDGGAPLIQTYTTTTTPSEEKTIVVGVLSKYSPTCDKTVPSVYTRLSVYYAWLNRVAGSQTPPPPTH